MKSSNSYHKPMVGPKYYTARGSSGWMESFPRDVADRELTQVLGSITLKIAIEGFQNQRNLMQRKAGIEWPDILDYLVTLTKTRESLISDGAGVAFWCQFLMANAAISDGKLN